jgi:hypothetical protein
MASAHPYPSAVGAVGGATAGGGTVVAGAAAVVGGTGAVVAGTGVVGAGAAGAAVVGGETVTGAFEGAAAAERIVVEAWEVRLLPELGADRARAGKAVGCAVRVASP